jgi:hypothetical protein
MPTHTLGEANRRSLAKFCFKHVRNLHSRLHTHVSTGGVLLKCFNVAIGTFILHLQIEPL